MTGELLAAISIPPLNEEMGKKVADYLDTLTKPPGSLGRLEEIAIELGKMTGQAFPEVTKAGVIVFAADHGITAEGVSAFPKEVTEQMVRNFLNGGAAINVFSRSIEADFAIVDIGIDSEIQEEVLTSKKIRRGAGNFYREDAMTREEAIRAIEVGIEEGYKMIDNGVKCLILGEMGIGNTSPSSAITAVLSGQDMVKLVGAGTGLANDKVLHKVKVIQEAIDMRKPNVEDPIDILVKIGGLEIAGMTGAMLAAASRRVPIIVDGFIATTSAVLAEKIAEGASHYMFVGHQSVEPGHVTAAELLGKKPLVDLGMRLGEGTGAAVAYPIIKAATLVLSEMATFANAGISGKE